MKKNYGNSGTDAAANVARTLKQILEGPDGRKLRGAAYRLCGNQGQAEELTQEACYRALRSASGYEATRRFVPWLLRILRNVYLDSKKGNRKLSMEHMIAWAEEENWLLKVPQLHVLADGTESNLDRAVRVEKEAKVARELAALRKIHRDAVVVRDFMGLSYAAGAKRLKLPMGTFRSRLSRARKVLRRRLGRGA